MGVETNQFTTTGTDWMKGTLILAEKVSATDGAALTTKVTGEWEELFIGKSKIVLRSPENDAYAPPELIPMFSDTESEYILPSDLQAKDGWSLDGRA